MKMNNWSFWPFTRVLITNDGFEESKINPANGEVWQVNASFQAPFTVRIRPEWIGNEGVFQHEMDHARTFDAGLICAMGIAALCAALLEVTTNAGWYSLGAFVAAYVAFMLLRRTKWYRMRDEAHAYAVQMRYPNGQGVLPSIEDVAARLASVTYSFGITDLEARELIKKHGGT